ncbi:hypothetical protein ABIB40_002200 [Pedobacter sp. UYP30]
MGIKALNNSFIYAIAYHEVIKAGKQSLNLNG